MKLLRGILVYVRKHGGFPRGYLSLVRRAYIQIVNAPQHVFSVASTFEEREEQLRLETLREPAALPKGASLRLRARPPAPLSDRVDVIVCVHNALEDVRTCLESVLEFTGRPYRLILVDDGSGQETSDFLAAFAAEHAAELIRHEEARGYTKSANAGLKHACSKYQVLLNSDTVVTPYWLERLVMCAEADPNVGLVGPLSNTASWQSIPEVEYDGDWAANELPSRGAIQRMSELVAKYSAQVYPSIVFLNGFCMLIKRDVLEDVGLFDEGSFEQGYGEENDFCLRAVEAGWQVRIADDAYVYHSQSRSYSNERRKKLVELAGSILEDKHGQEKIVEGLNRTKKNRVLAGVRARSRYLEERECLIERGRQRWYGRSLAFVLPVKFQGGGSKVILQEAAAMKRMGVDVAIVNLEMNRQAFESAHGAVEVDIRYVPTENDVASAVRDSDAVVATAWTSAQWLGRCKHQTRLGYYIQDFEPDFYPVGTTEHHQALKTYSDFPAHAYFTKTRWTAERVERATGVASLVVGPSFDSDLFRPRLAGSLYGDSKTVCIAAMIRPSTPRRNAAGTVEVLRRLSDEYGDQIRIVTFGTNSTDPLLGGLDLSFPHENFGVQSSEGLALLFNETDIFLDLSTFQAMGLTAMEAMSSGAATIVPRNGGATEFARHEELALVVDTTSLDDVLLAAKRLLDDPILKGRLARNAVEDLPRYHPEGPAYRILDALFS